MRSLHLILLFQISVFSVSARAQDPFDQLFENEKASAIASIQKSCPSYHFEKAPFSINDHTRAAGLWNKGSARNRIADSVVYRGANYMNIVDVTYGLLGDLSGYVGSRMHSELVQVFTLKHKLQSIEPKTLEELNEEAAVVKSIKELVECAPNDGFTIQEANVLAADIIDKYYYAKANQDKIETLYAHQVYPIFRDWGKEVMFGAYQRKVALAYSANVVSYLLKERRGLDIGFWSFAFEPGWEQKFPCDRTEMLTAGYVRPDELMGLQTYDVSIFRQKSSATARAVLLAATSSDCVMEALDGRFYFCTDRYNYNSGNEFDPGPTLEKNAQLIPLGVVISACSTESECAADEAYFNSYGAYDKLIGYQYENTLKQITINGTPVHLLVANESGKKAEIKPPVSVVDILSANWGEYDVTAKAQAFCNGKTDCGYKVSKKYTFDTAPDGKIAGDFVVSWNCTVGGKVFGSTKTSTTQKPDNKIVNITCP